MLQFNTLIIHVVRLKDLPVKSGRHLDAYASLNITGTDKWRSKVSTQPQRVDENGCCHWDEHLEFQLNENYTDFQININHKSKLGSSETLASIILKLNEMEKMQNARWFQLYKKGHPEKLRGMILMAYEFKNTIGGLSISQTSLNTIGSSKENKLDKLKRRMHFGRKKAKMDAQSMISVNLSRRSSICSNSSALAFSPAPSPVPMNHASSQQQDRISLPSDPTPPAQTYSNHLTLPNNRYGNEKRLSSVEDSVSRCSDVGSESGSAKKYTPSRFAEKFRKKADKLLHSSSHRKLVEDFQDHPVQTAVVNNSRPNSIASSGFASTTLSASGNLDNLNEGSSKEYLLSVITQLRKELHLKEQRIQSLEDYTGRLLSKIIDKHPEILQVN